MRSSDSLEARLRRVEDYLDICQLINAYGPAADSNNIDALRSTWHGDCRYVVDSPAQRQRDASDPERSRLRGTGIYEGHAGLEFAINREQHLALLESGMAHVSSMPYIVIEGSSAKASNYAMLFVNASGQFTCTRVVASRWLLVRDDEGWKVKDRQSALLNGDPEARAILEEAMAPL